MTVKTALQTLIGKHCKIISNADGFIYYSAVSRQEWIDNESMLVNRPVLSIVRGRSVKGFATWIIIID